MTVHIKQFAHSAVWSPTPELAPGAADGAVRAAAAAADDVDRDSRFPIEAVDELRTAGLLSCSLPTALGGRDTGIGELAHIARRLGAACSSAGMVFAMHHSQALTLAQHGDFGPIAELTATIAAEEALLASATTELATGGDVRSSSCAVQHDPADPARIVLEKNAPVISYAHHADYILVTARRGPDSPASDQVLLVCPVADLTLEQTSTWDVTGFRGTCSPGFMLRANTSDRNVLPVDYATISAVTMLPSSHILWASVWLGMADAALAKARAAARSAARRAAGGPVPAAGHLADLSTLHAQFESTVLTQSDRYAGFLRYGGADPTVGFTLSMNNLKLSASTLVVDIVTGALAIVGINGYRRDHPSSMDRLLRDCFAPQLMVSNERIRANNAVLALAQRTEGTAQ